MKKLIKNDINIRNNYKKIEKKRFILKSIFKNENFFQLIRWNAFYNLQNLLDKKNYKVSIVSRCLKTINKKRFNKLTYFSRHVFLKLLRSGFLSGIKKASW